MNQSKFWKYINICFMVALATTVIIFGSIYAIPDKSSQQSASPTKPEAHLQTQEKNNAPVTNFGGREVSIGNPHAPLTVVMYYSLTCPHCHEYQKDELPKIQKEYIDKNLVRFVFRDFPTDSTAIKAAKIAWCHGTQQYLDFARKLLETQEKWVPIDVAKIKEADKAFFEIATHDLGISQTDFNKCMANTNIEASILRQSFEAQKVHEITAAPAFLLNGKYFDGIVTTDVIQKKLFEMGIHSPDDITPKKRSAPAAP
jgi:protein-disulfide isomerase